MESMAIVSPQLMKKKENGNAIILNNAIEKYVVADNSKFDSYSFYSLPRGRSNAIITDDSIPKDQRQIRLVYENHLQIKWSQKEYLLFNNARNDGWGAL